MRLQIPAFPARSLLGKLIRAGLQAADPFHTILRRVSREGHILRVGRRRYDLQDYERVMVVGAGKAAGRMAQALEHVLGSRLESGLVVVKKGHRVPTKRVMVLEAGHPIPNRAGLRAAAELRKRVADCGPRDLLFVLISGGASSLIPAPVQGISLADKQMVTEPLLRSGATIQEINVVRKHLSAIKGGRLAESTKARIITVILSDVIGDDLASIGSGPTAPDPSSFQEAITVLTRYRLWASAPESIREHLARGRRGLVGETPKPGTARFKLVQHEIVGNNAQAVAAVEQAARQAGLRTVLFSTALIGEASQLGEAFALLGRRLAAGKGMLRRPCCVVAGGETTVTVTGHGTGGRAQEFAVAAALGIAGLSNMWIAAVGTDGTDGPTDVAGAVISGSTAEQAKRTGVSLRRALTQHDSYAALQTLNSHIVTGPTGTNVNDLYILLAL